MLRSLIRAHLQTQENGASPDQWIGQIAADTAGIQRELAALRLAIDRLSSQGIAVPAAQADPTPFNEARLSEEDARRRLTNMMSRKW